MLQKEREKQRDKETDEEKLVEKYGEEDRCNVCTCMKPGAAMTTQGPTVSKSDRSIFFMKFSLNGLATSIIPGKEWLFHYFD